MRRLPFRLVQHGDVEDVLERLVSASESSTSEYKIGR